MATKEDKEWVASLINNRAGRFLANHLASMELSNQSDGRDCAASESVANERVFIYAIARAVYHSRPYPFGLSAHLPRFIAILNLSGERMLVYSDKPALIRCLCSRSSALMPGDLGRALVAFEAFPMTNRGDGSTQFTLLTYSLPWQSGTHAAFWHLSACAVKPTEEDSTVLRLADRLLQFSSASPAAYRGKSVLHGRDSKLSCYLPSAGALELVSDKQISDFTESYSATCLDFTSTPEAQVNGSKEAQLRGMLQELQRGRKEDQEKNRQLEILVGELGEQMQERVDVMTREHGEAVDELKKGYDEKLEVAQQQYAELNAQMEAIERSQKERATKTKRIAKDNERLVAQHDELVRKCTAKDQLNNAALSKHVATISKLEGRLAASQEQVEAIRAEMQREHCASIAKVQREHEEALAKASLALESKKRIINQLSENNERRDVEVASLKTHEEEQERRIRDLEAEVHQCAKRMAEKPVRTKSSGPRKNASTSTHSCASTQTDPPRAEAPAAAEALVLAVSDGKGAVQEAQPLHAPSPMLTYQTALDMLQELVHQSGYGAAPQHAPPVNGYARPLPFPHFTPGMAYPHAHVRPYLHQPPPPQQQQRPMVAYAPSNYQPAPYQSSNNY